MSGPWHLCGHRSVQTIHRLLACKQRASYLSKNIGPAVAGSSGSAPWKDGKCKGKRLQQNFLKQIVIKWLEVTALCDKLQVTSTLSSPCKVNFSTTDYLRQRYLVFTFPEKYEIYGTPTIIALIASNYWISLSIKPSRIVLARISEHDIPKSVRTVKWREETKIH